MIIAPGIIIGNWYQLSDGRYFQVDSYHSMKKIVVIRFSDGTEEHVMQNHWYELEPMPLSSKYDHVTPFGIYYESEADVEAVEKS